MRVFNKVLICGLLLAPAAAAQVIGPNPLPGGPPTGAAGGDLTGTYPNPTLASKITAGGPTGSATVAPIITYNAAGQLTTVTSATITPAVGSITGLGTGVAALLAGNSSGTGGPAGTISPTFTGTANFAATTFSGTAAVTNALLTITTNAGSFGAVRVINSAADAEASIGYRDSGDSDAQSWVAGKSVGGTDNFGWYYNGLRLSLATNGDFTTTAGIFASGIGSDAALVDRSVCQVVSTGELKYGSGVAGVCLGTSSSRFKTGIESLAPGLVEILALRPKSFYLDAAHGDPKKQLYGFIAEDMVSILPKLVGRDAQGRVNTADYLGVVPVLVNAVHQIMMLLVALGLMMIVLAVLLFRLRGKMSKLCKR